MLRKIEINYFIIPFTTKYLTTKNQSIQIETTLLPLSSATIPENIINSGSYSLIAALFDKEKNKYKRWIERPLKYTFDSIHNRKSLLKTLGYSIISSTSSAIIPSYKSSSNEIIWNIIGQIGTNAFLAIVNHFL